MVVSNTLSLPGEASAASLEHGSIFFVGNATTVIRYGGMTLLTDPNFLHAGDHVHLGYGLTSQRLHDPAIEIDALPPLDLCLLSHMHGDHWDRIAEARLPKSLPIVTTHHAARALRRQGFTAPHPLSTWDSITVRKGDVWLRVTSMPGRHGPPLISKLLPPVMGSMLEWGTGPGAPRFVLYISGDTLVFDRLYEISRRYPSIHLALIHLGGTRIVGVLVTMDAQQGVQALRIIRPQKAIPIHFNDYTVMKSPLEAFMREVEKAGLSATMHYLGRGETYEFEIPEG